MGAVFSMLGGVYFWFEKITGVGALMNTSFNIHGEPIVGTPDDAISTFKRCGLNHLYIGEHLISKNKK